MAMIFCHYFHCGSTVAIESGSAASVSNASVVPFWLTHIWCSLDHRMMTIALKIKWMSLRRRSLRRYTISMVLLMLWNITLSDSSKEIFYFLYKNIFIRIHSNLHPSHLPDPELKDALARNDLLWYPHVQPQLRLSYCRSRQPLQSTRRKRVLI